LAEKYAWTRRDSLTSLATAILAVLLYLPRWLPSVLSAYDIDSRQHVVLAQRLFETHVLILPHFLYEALVIAVHALIPWGSWWVAGTVATMLVVAGTTAIVYRLVRPVVPGSDPLRAGLWAGFITLCLMTVTPIILLTLPFGNVYFGYVAITNYSSPSLIMVRPLALMLFVLVVSNLFVKTKSCKPHVIAGAALLTVLSALAKPSFAVCFIPALLVVALYKQLKGSEDRIDLKLVLLGVVLPGILTMWLQFITYPNPLGLSTIFAPFATYAEWGLPAWLLPKLLLSLAFPLSVLLYFRKQALRDPLVMVGWVNMVFGLLYMYFLAEHPHKYISCGDWLWGAMISLYILFVVTTMFLLRTYSATAEISPSASRSRRICWWVFGMHVLSGGAFWLIWMLFGNQGRPEALARFWLVLKNPKR